MKLGLTANQAVVFAIHVLQDCTQSQVRASALLAKRARLAPLLVAALVTFVVLALTLWPGRAAALIVLQVTTVPQRVAVNALHAPQVPFPSWPRATAPFA